MLQFEGSSTFRHVIVCSILSRRPITINRIRVEEDPPGIQAHEANFLKFVDRFTTGSTFQVSEQNTKLVFNPGMILGGVFSHEVPTQRCVTYVAEAVLLLMPFAKYDSRVTLVGSTQSEYDLCVDTLRTVTTRWVNLFGVQSSVRLIRRGCAPGGNGAIEVSCQAVRRLKSINVIDRGMVKRIRGISFACKVAPDLPQRAATAAKGVLLGLLPDVYVVTDVDDAKNRRQEMISGYGVMLVAETTSKTCVISQETIAMASTTVRESPEEVGQRAAHLLLDQIFEAGCIDGHHQMLVLLMMALTPDEISTAKLGPLNSSGVSALIMMETFFGVTCAVKEEKPRGGDNEEDERLPAPVLVTCMGSNTVNVWKKSS